MMAGVAEGQTPTAEDGITAADLAAVNRVTGLHYNESDRELMAPLAQETRGQLATLRDVNLDPLSDPATRFDPLLPGMRLKTGRSVCRLSRQAAPNYHGKIESLAFCTVADLARLMRTRRISSVDLTTMYLARLKKFGPHLNCVVNLTEALAMQQAKRADAEIAAGHYRGPLHGIPWGAKDLFATRGIPTTWGAKPYEHQVFDYNATVVDRLEAAGAVLVAKLSMGELAMGDVWFGGRTRNPWRPSSGSSGSSAGPGSATAAGLVGFSLGTETLGSIVSPSVVNGVTGLRPTFGRVSRHGAMPLSWTMDKIGPMCRGVEDCALVLSAIQGADGKDATVVDTPFRWEPGSSLQKWKFGINQAAFDAVGRDPAGAGIYKAALETFQKLGVTLHPITLPVLTEAYGAVAELIINCEGAASFARLNADGGLAQLAQQQAHSWPNLFRVGSTVPAADYLQGLRIRRRLQEQMAAAMGDLDGFVSVPFAGPTLVYTNLTGHPALITRCGMQDGMPRSLEFVGGLYKEAEILRLAFAYEQATTWHKQWPDTEALLAASASEN